MPAGETRGRPTASGRRQAASRRHPADGRAADRRVAATGRGSALPEPVVVGPVPPLARAAGGVLVAAGLAGAVGAFLTYLVVDGRVLALAAGPGSALVALLVPAVDVALGVLLLRGRVPKLGLAYAVIDAALSVGLLLIELYRGSSSTARPAMEVLAGQLVLTSSVRVGAGWVLGVVALALTVVAGCVAMLAWGRTLMEDDGRLDAVRGPLAGAAVLLAVTTVLCMALPAADVPTQLVTDPTTGMQTVVTSEGPQALLERPGLALLGGLLLAGAVLLCSVIVASLRPRLAAVGGLLAIAAVVLSAGLTGLRDALSSRQLEWTVPGVGLLLAGLGYALLTVLAWRLRRSRPPTAARTAPAFAEDPGFPARS